MKITNPFLRRAFGFLGTTCFRSLIGTIDFKWAFYDPRIDADVAKRKYILMFWHEHILCPLFFRRHSPVTMLLSGHGDAEIVSQAAGFVGMKCIRGSSSHGSVAALKQFAQLKDQDILAFTPDGPRGPYRHMEKGAIWLASQLQLPIVLLGVGYDRIHRMSTWDRFVVPYPFSRGRIISSPMFPIPKRLSRDDLEHYRQKMETLLTQLTDEAEAWAISGEPLAGESTVCMGPKSSIMYYGYSKKAVLSDDWN
ncbi:MAG: lysophospholipid acyltransferase family protein [Planctomycetaceae bacterium]|nr:lysophospholipid acyltransferase family protein [Planctomycetaceae bacterium]